MINEIDILGIMQDPKGYEERLLKEKEQQEKFEFLKQFIIHNYIGHRDPYDAVSTAVECLAVVWERKGKL